MKILPPSLPPSYSLLSLLSSLPCVFLGPSLALICNVLIVGLNSEFKDCD